MPDVYVSIGSNINREHNIPSGLNAMRQQFGDLLESSVYETNAVGFEGSPFYNLSVKFETTLAIVEIAWQLKQIEITHGRTRKSAKFSGRSLDLDILLYGDEVINSEKIKVPRDDILIYAFVLEPLAEIAPSQRHPVTQQNFATLWKNYDKTGLEQKIILPPWEYGL